MWLNGAVCWCPLVLSNAIMFHRLTLPWLCAGLVSLSVALLSFLLLVLRKSKHPGQPPSPATLPLVGNLHQLGSLPHRSLRDMSRRLGPVMLLHFGPTPTVVVSSAAAAKEVMKTHDNVFATRPDSSVAARLFYGPCDIGFSKYGNYWRQVRRVCVLHLLSVKQVQSFRQVREEEVTLLVRRVSAAAGRPANIGDMVVSCITDVFCRIALGKKHFAEGEGSGGERVRALFSKMMEVLGQFSVRDLFPGLGWIDRLTGLDERVREIQIEIDDFMERVLKEHDGKNNNKMDFVDILLSLDFLDGESLSKDSIKAIILDMFTGGIDTAFTTIEWAMAELIRHPEDMRRAQEELRGAIDQEGSEIGEAVEGMEFLQAVIKETLRLHPPLPLLVPREAMEDARVQDYRIPKGTRVMINAWAIGRDPNSWEMAEEFRPQRFLEDKNKGLDFKGQEFHYVPFGAGRRGCPGVSFGIATVELVLANLLYHFDWELPHGTRQEEMDVSESPGILVRRKFGSVLVAKPVSQQALSLGFQFGRTTIK